MSGKEERPNHVCIWVFVEDDEEEDFDTMECTICEKKMTVSVNPDKKEAHGQIWTSLGSPRFGMS